MAVCVSEHAHVHACISVYLNTISSAVPPKRQAHAGFPDALPRSLYRCGRGSGLQALSPSRAPSIVRGQCARMANVFTKSSAVFTKAFSLFLLQPSMSLKSDMCSAWTKWHVCMWIIAIPIWLLYQSLQLQKWLPGISPQFSVPGNWHHDCRVQVICLMAPAPAIWES